MSTPWIKMRTDLLEDPRVGRLAFELDCPSTLVIGGLYVLWSLADKFSLDGAIPHLTDEALDSRVSLPGFSNALRVVGWLETSDDASGGFSGGVVIPRFDEHNGQSAKRRAQDSARKGSVRKASASKEDTMRTPCGTEQSKSRADREKSKNKDKAKAKSAANKDKVSSGGEDACLGASFVTQLASDKRLVRAFDILTKQGGVSSRNMPESVSYLREITENGRDPAAILSKIIDNAQGAINKGGYVFSSLREEAKQK